MSRDLETRAERDVRVLAPKLKFLNRHPRLAAQLAEELVKDGWTQLQPGEHVSREVPVR